MVRHIIHGSVPHGAMYEFTYIYTLATFCYYTIRAITSF